MKKSADSESHGNQRGVKPVCLPPDTEKYRKRKKGNKKRIWAHLVFSVRVRNSLPWGCKFTLLNCGSTLVSFFFFSLFIPVPELSPLSCRSILSWSWARELNCRTHVIQQKENAYQWNDRRFAKCMETYWTIASVEEKKSLAIIDMETKKRKII